MSRELSIVEGGGKLKRRPVQLAGASLAFMCFQTLGIIYSDIGTSYVLIVLSLFLFPFFLSDTPPRQPSVRSDHTDVLP